MNRQKTKVATLSFLVVMLGLAIVLPSVLAAPRRPVYVRATLRDALMDKVLSDGLGPYANAPYITATISEIGELHINIEGKSGRRVVFIFDEPIAPFGTCQELPPDTAGGEPAGFSFFATHNGTSYEVPQVNLLTMTDGQEAQVTMWIGFDTDLRSGTFYSKWNRDYNPDDPTRKASFLTVKATDETGDGIVDRWIFSPIPGTNDKANLHRVWKATRGYAGHCDYGNFRMPFELVIDRL